MTPSSPAPQPEPTLRLVTVDPLHPDAVFAVEAYFAELDRRFPDGFAPGDAIVSDAPNLRAPTGSFVVAYLDDRPVACGGVQTITATDGLVCAEIKRMWVADDARGRGLGPRLLAHLESLGSASGRDVIRLDTNEALPEAIAMYERNGYHRIERYNDNPYPTHFFEKRLPAR